MSVKSLGVTRFFVIFKDNASDFRHVYFLKHKSEIFREYEQLISNKFGCMIKILQANNNREYSNEISKGI